MGEASIILLLVGIAVIAIALIYLSWRAAQKRREAFFRLATRLGLEYSIKDPFDTPSLPFDLFGRGERRGAENVIHGEIGGIRVRLFDYWFQVTQHNSNGPDPF